MSETTKLPKLGCGTVALVGVLALLVVVALQRHPEPPSWASTGAAAIAVVAVFLVARAVQNIFWGLMAAVLLTFHPCWQEHTDSHAIEVLSGAMVLAVMAGACVGWQLAFQPRFGVRAWPLLLAALSLGIGLAWKGDAYLGLLAAGISSAGLLLASFLASRMREHNPESAPSALNLVAAALLGVLAPAGGLVVYRFFDRSLNSAQGWWPLVRDSFPASLQPSTAAFSSSALESWCWPHPWLTLPLLGWAVFALGRSGWQHWRKRETPTGWFVGTIAGVLFVGLFLAPASTGQGLPLILTSVTVLLLTALVADLLNGAFDRLVLHPPEAGESAPVLRAPPAREVAEEKGLPPVVPR
jgi:hypothetical protein